MNLYEDVQFSNDFLPPECSNKEPAASIPGAAAPTTTTISMADLPFFGTLRGDIVETRVPQVSPQQQQHRKPKEFDRAGSPQSSLGSPPSLVVSQRTTPDSVIADLANKLQLQQPRQTLVEQSDDDVSFFKRVAVCFEEMKQVLMVCL